jgi:hypothetical protein
MITRTGSARRKSGPGSIGTRYRPGSGSAASRVINASQNHYSPAEGVSELREAVAQKISLLNGMKIDALRRRPSYSLLRAQRADSSPSRTHICRTPRPSSSNRTTLSPSHPRRVGRAYGGSSAGWQNLELDGDELRARCRDLKNAARFRCARLFSVLQ